MKLLWAFGDDTELSIHAHDKVGMVTVDFSNTKAADVASNNGEETF